MTKQIKDDAKVFVEIWRKWKNARTEISINQHQNRLLRMADKIIKNGHYEIWFKEVSKLMAKEKKASIPKAKV